MIKFYLKKHYTVHVEVEAILNSRLLTAVSDDVNNYVALTPNHFLIGRASNNSPPGHFKEGEINSCKRWRMAQALVVHSLLPRLYSRHKSIKSNNQ